LIHFYKRQKDWFTQPEEKEENILLFQPDQSWPV